MNTDHLGTSISRMELARSLRLGLKVRPVLSPMRVAVLLLLTALFYKDYWSLITSIVSTFSDVALPHLHDLPGPSGWSTWAFIYLPAAWLYMLTSAVQISDGTFAVWLLAWRPRRTPQRDIVALCQWSLWQHLDTRTQFATPVWLRRVRLSVMFVCIDDADSGTRRWMSVWALLWIPGADEVLRDELLSQCGLAQASSEKPVPLGALYRRPGDAPQLPALPVQSLQDR